MEHGADYETILNEARCRRRRKKKKKKKKRKEKLLF